jgi:biopolymer transport protein ExbB/TolQ
MGFLTSKFSGYLSIVLLLSVIGGAWYMYQRGVTFGELQAAADALEAIEAEQEEKRKQLARQSQTLEQGRREANELREQLRQAEAKADEAFTMCMDMPVPDGMRIRQQ